MSRFYGGLDTRGWGKGELATWEANVPRLLAEETLRERGGSLRPQELYNAILLTTGDKLKADVARSRRTLEEMREQG